jgi:lysophospholipase L1-like esterase
MNASILLRHKSLVLAVITCSVILTMFGCGGSSHKTVQAGPLSTVIFTGDSLTAGYQNGSLWQQQQPHGYAALVAQQGGFEFIQPLVADPGVPAALELVSVGPPPVIQQMSGTSTGRVNQLMWPTDLAVPGHKLTDLINYGPVIPPVTGEDIITDIVLAYPPGNTGSQLQQAVADKPTTLFVWVGNNDALVADISGTPAAMTSVSDFTTQFTSLMTTLQSQTTAKLIVANIPDVTLVPYLFPAPVVVAQTQATLASYGVNIDTGTLSAMMGVGPGDYVNLEEGVQTEVPAFVSAILHAQPPSPLSDSAILSAAEVAQVQATVNAYNGVIAAQVSSAGGTLVDIHSLFAAIGDCRIPGVPCSGGVTLGGYTATNAYLGGLFSLDGIHPTNTGYAIIANTFIDALNAATGSSATHVDVATVAASDPLFPPNFPTGATKQFKTGQLPKGGIPKSAFAIFHR